MRPETETALEPLLLDPDGPAVVAVGGGHGQAAALEAIQSYAGAISALVSVADDGGSSGRLTKLGIPPPGDIRRCLLALTPEPTLASELFAHRFTDGDVADHSLGNLMLAALTDLFGDFASAVRAAQRMLGTLGDVIPVADRPVTLSATIDGTSVTGQVAVATTNGTITDLQIDPADTMASREALKAVSGADQIVLGPGSLYTSVISALLVQMLAPSIVDCDAQKVVVLNLMTQGGETSGMGAREHLEELSKYTGIQGPGVVVMNNTPFDVPDGHTALVLSAEDGADLGWDVVGADLVDEAADWPSHDPIKLGEILESVLNGRT